jgi:hypothetical protein
MALIRNLNKSIELEISDKVIQSTIVKRKAKLFSLTYSPQEEQVVINIAIFPFAATSEGGYGASLAYSGLFQVEYKQLIADNNTLVNPSTGEILVDKIPSNIDSVFAAPIPEIVEVPEQLDEAGNIIQGHVPGVSAIPAGPLFGQDAMYEFEFYKLIAANQPVVIDNLIISKIQQADAAGRI